jgi:large subunit ribosomal protein L13
MKTPFAKKEGHIPKYFLVDATGKTLGRLATEISKLLRGKEIAYFSPGIDQGNFVVVINAEKILISGKKESQKMYYRTSQRPGSLKSQSFAELKERFPARIVEKAVWGMLPKGVLGRKYYQRLFVYSGDLVFKKNQNVLSLKWTETPTTRKEKTILKEEKKE